MAPCAPTGIARPEPPESLALLEPLQPSNTNRQFLIVPAFDVLIYGLPADRSASAPDPFVKEY